VIVRTMEEELERMRDDARRNEASALANAERKAKLKMAKTLLAEGVGVETIARSSGFTVDEILKL